MSDTPTHDPNAPLEAFQRHLDDEHRFLNGPGDSFHQSSDLPTGGGRGVHRLGHLPDLDAQEGSDNE